MPERADILEWQRFLESPLLPTRIKVRYGDDSILLFELTSTEPVTYNLRGFAREGRDYRVVAERDCGEREVEALVGMPLAAIGTSLFWRHPT